MEDFAVSDPGDIERDAIAKRAYEIWEAEGRPHGCDRDHWERAAQELGSPVPVPNDFKASEALPGLAAATKKAPVRRKKTVADPESAEAAKPARRRRASEAPS